MGFLGDSKKINNLLMIILFIILISCIVFTVTPGMAQFKPGSVVPDFELEALDSKKYQLSQFYNKQDHLLLCFLKSDDSGSITKLQDLISFFEDYQPRESYQIIAIVEAKEDNKNLIEDLNSIQNNTEIPLLILLNKNNQTIKNIQIENYPTILLLRHDLKIRKAYSGFNTRTEKSFYQYLKFTFTSQKSSETDSGCNGGVCPPPEIED